MYTCLVIDDDSASRFYLSEVAKNCNFEVLEAHNGLYALEICKKSMPDVIIVDWMMPEKNGIDFMKDLKDIETEKHPKVVMCSARFSNQDISTGIEAGAEEYLRKPVRTRDLEGMFKGFSDRHVSK
jgi:two-component system chemotaxis response regulator CheY